MWTHKPRKFLPTHDMKYLSPISHYCLTPEKVPVLFTSRAAGCVIIYLDLNSCLCYCLPGSKQLPLLSFTWIWTAACVITYLDLNNCLCYPLPGSEQLPVLWLTWSWAAAWSKWFRKWTLPELELFSISCLRTFTSSQVHATYYKRIECCKLWQLASEILLSVQPYCIEHKCTTYAWLLHNVLLFTPSLWHLL